MVLITLIDMAIKLYHIILVVKNFWQVFVEVGGFLVSFWAGKSSTQSGNHCVLPKKMPLPMQLEAAAVSVLPINRHR